MEETQTVIRVPRDTWSQFKAECIRRRIAPTAIIVSMVAERTAQMLQETQEQTTHPKGKRS